MNKKYICPRHNDSRPSAHAYADHFFCFVCHARGPLTELGVDPGERIEITYVEDLQATLSYIDSLPKQNVRGFSLPSGPRGYYIVWPDRSYYKLRVAGAEDGQKYRGPAGHKKPWFIVKESGKTLVLVEGEFNAMSLALVAPHLSIMSPGGAGDFFSKYAEKALQKLTTYETVFLVTDDDKAGAQAAINACAKLKHYGLKDVRIRLAKKDFNDTYTEEGAEALKAQIREMGMPGGV